jgi:hypothetical protein
MPSISDVQWITTSPNPYKVQMGYDCGQMGWRLHAVVATPQMKFSELGRQRSVCGIRPRWGWNLDLFIERKCARCAKKLGMTHTLSGEWE